MVIVGAVAGQENRVAGHDVPQRNVMGEVATSAQHVADFQQVGTQGGGYGCSGQQRGGNLGEQRILLRGRQQWPAVGAVGVVVTDQAAGRVDLRDRGELEVIGVGLRRDAGIVGDGYGAAEPVEVG